MDFADVDNMPPPRGYQGSDYDPAIARHFDHPLTSGLTIAVLLFFFEAAYKLYNWHF